eukprot:8202001-Pyramimonas_sp.AAC.1
MASISHILGKLRADRDSGKHEPQLHQAMFTKLSKAQKQLEAQEEYIDQQTEALEDLEIKRALMLADLESAKQLYT